MLRREVRDRLAETRRVLRVRAGKHRRLVGRDQFADRVRIALNAGLAKLFATSATDAVHAFGNAFVHADSSILMRPIQGGIEMRENPQQPLYGLPAADRASHGSTLRR